MVTSCDKKMSRLRSALKETGGIAIAYSGGVDSTFLVAVAREVLGDRVLAVTATSPTYPQRERDDAVRLAVEMGVKHEVIESNELEIDGFCENPTNRCYYCKKELFGLVKDIAKKHGISVVADGTTADDLSDHRPGRQAAQELGVLSPLLDAGLGKAEIRQVSAEMGLETATKAAFACLASRFPYGSVITADKLKAVESVEDELRTQGFHQIRVRHHGDTARIEIDIDQMRLVLNPAVRAKIVDATKAAGFSYVTLDLEGYRTGSMNIDIKED